MGATIKIHIKGARNLPVMDRASNLTDAYVQVKFGTHFEYTTSVCKKTLDPIFDESCRIEVTDISDLRDTMIEFVLWDSDILSSDDVIGTVCVDAQLILQQQNSHHHGHHTMAGWLPIYDSFRGICGELLVTIKVDVLAMESARGHVDGSLASQWHHKVQFYSNYDQTLVTNYVNTMRSLSSTPNSALSSTAAIVPNNGGGSSSVNSGLMASHMFSSPLSANSSSNNSSVSSVLDAQNNNCYYEMSKINMIEEMLIDDDPEHDYWKDMMRSSRSSNIQRQLLLFQLSGKVKRLMAKKVSESGCNTVVGYYEQFDLESENIVVRGMGTECRLERQIQSLNEIHLQNLIFDTSAALPRKMSITGSPGGFQLSLSKSPQLSTSVESAPAFKMTSEDVALCTMRVFEPSEVKYVASVVQCRAVKLLSDVKIAQMGKERDQWWNEMRQEVRENARMLGCSHIIGYSEKAHMHPKSNICILSAEGTAAILSDNMYASSDMSTAKSSCPYSIFHVLQSDDNPFAPKKQLSCHHCKKAQVPEIIFSTCEPPNVPFIGQHFLEARICRTKSRKVGESNAKVVSTMLPFIEYDLHKQMLHKMRIYHVNAVFNVTYDIAVDDSYIVATVTGTGVHLGCLPEPTPLNITVNKNSAKIQLARVQLAEMNAAYKQDMQQQISQFLHSSVLTDDDDSDSLDDNDELDYKFATTDFMNETGDVIEIDDVTDEDKMVALIDPVLPGGVTFSNLRSTSTPEGFNSTQATNLHNIFMQKRYDLSKIVATEKNEQQFISAVFNDLYSSIAFKLLLFVNSSRNVYSVSVNGITTDVQFSDEAELMITFQAMAMLNVEHQPKIPLQSVYPVLLPNQVFMPVPTFIEKKFQQPKVQVVSINEQDLMFPMEEAVVDNPMKAISQSTEVDEDTQWLNNIYVTMTPLSYVAGARIIRVVGKITQHFVRESDNTQFFGAFQQELVMEANAVIRAHAKALGMNCLLNYDLRFHVCSDNTTRRHAYAVLTVSGDAAQIVHENRKQNGLRSIIALSSK